MEFSKQALKRISKLAKDLNAVTESSYYTGGGHHHICFQMPDMYWVCCHSAEGDVTVTSKPYTTKEEFDDAWDEEIEEISDLCPAHYKSNTSFIGLAVVVSDIVNNQFVSAYNDNKPTKR